MDLFNDWAKWFNRGSCVMPSAHLPRLSFLLVFAALRPHMIALHRLRWPEQMQIASHMTRTMIAFGITKPISPSFVNVRTPFNSDRRFESTGARLVGFAG